MRVAIIAAQFADYSVQLAEALARDAEVLLVLDRSLRERECDDDLMVALRHRVTLVEYRYTGSLSRALTFLWVCLRVLLFRPDILHVQEQADRSTARIVRFLAPRYPMVLTVHDPKPHTGRDASWAEKYGRYRDEMRGLADAFHVHGDFCRRELLSVIGDDRPIVSTMHGVILAPRPDQRREPESQRLLFFGRMEAYKGVEALLDATDQLNASGLAPELVFAGRGPELDRLRNRLTAMPAVTVKEGFLTPAEAIAEFQAASAVVVPYRDATQSGVVAAAFANGRPCVGTRIGGLVDAIDEGVTGLLVDVGDTNGLAQAMQTVLTDAEVRNRLGAGVADVARRSFAWSSVASTLMEAYRGLMRSGKGRSRQH